MNVLQSLNNLGSQFKSGYASEENILWHALELGAKSELTMTKKKSVVVLPKGLGRSNNTLPNYLYDTPVYVYGNDSANGSKKKTAFWQQAVDICTAAGDKEALKAVKAAMEAPLTPPPKLAGWVVLTLKGALLADRPLIRKFLQEQFEVPSDGDDFCLVTGERCVPARCHHQINGVAGTGGPAKRDEPPSTSNVPVMSWNKLAFQYNGQEQGRNFPVSETVNRQYTVALSYLLESVDGRRHRSAADLTNTNTLVFWPETDTMSYHPLLGLLSDLMGNRYLKTEEIQALWVNIESCEVPDVSVRVVLLKGSKGRMSLLRDDLTTLPKLKESMLRFQHEAYWKWSPTFHNVVRDDDLELPDPVTNAVAWAMVMSEPFPTALSRQLTQYLLTKPQHLQTIAAWLDTIERRSNPKKDTIMTETSTEDPKAYFTENLEVPEAFFNAELCGNSAYTFGRLVVLANGLHSQYHSRNKVAGTLARELQHGSRNPRNYFPQLLKEGTFYCEKIEAKGLHPLLRYQWKELIGELQDLPRRLTPMQRMHLALGNAHQMRFNDRFRRWRWLHNSTDQDSENPKKKPKEGEIAA